MKTRNSIRFSLCLYLVLFEVVCQANYYQAYELIQESDSNLVYDEIIKKVEELAINYYNDGNTPGLAAAVVSDKEILWSVSLGTLHGESQRNVDSETLFNIQSMSKSFTALAVLFAVQDGLVELDTPISEYIPGFTINSRWEEAPEKLITLRHLLSHRSGIVHDAPYGNNTDLMYDWGLHIESLSSTWLQYPVGYTYSYSNGGIDLAGYILEKVTGISYPQYLKERVFKHLGMDSSSADFDKIESISNRAKGIWRSSDPLPLKFSMIPSGAVYTNIRDMAQYLMFHINKGKVSNNQLLCEDLLDEYHSIQFAEPDQKFGYALGLLRMDAIKPYGVMHTGGGFGFFSYMYINPGMKLGIIFMTNSQARGLEMDSFRFADDIILEKMNGKNFNKVPEWDKLDVISINDPRIQNRIGKYGENSPALEIENDELKIDIYGKRYSILFYELNGDIIGCSDEEKEMVVRFLPDYGEQRGAMLVYNSLIGNSGQHLYCFNESPSENPGPDKPEWDKFLGEYESVYHGRRLFKQMVHRKNGYLYWGQQKMTEYDDGVFFLYDGWEVNFNEDPPRIGHYKLTSIK